MSIQLILALLALILFVISLFVPNRFLIPAAGIILAALHLVSGWK